MASERHPAVDLVRQKILFLLDEWIARGYSPERISEMCGLSKVHIYALLKQPDHPGYKGSNLTLNTAFKIWTGLGNPLETLLEDCDVDYSDIHKGVNIRQILAVSKQVLDFDIKIMDTVLKRRAITPRKMEQIESILASTKEIVEDIKMVLSTIDKSQGSSTTPQPSPAASRQTKTKKRR